MLVNLQRMSRRIHSGFRPSITRSFPIFLSGLSGFLKDSCDAFPHEIPFREDKDNISESSTPFPSPPPHQIANDPPKIVEKFFEMVRNRQKSPPRANNSRGQSEKELIVSVSTKIEKIEFNLERYEDVITINRFF